MDLHCEVCSKDHKRYRRALHFGCASTEWFAWFCNWHKMFLPFWPCFAAKWLTRVYRICQGSKIGKATTHQSALWLDKWPILAIHFVVKAAGVTQIMAIAISSP